MSVAPRQRVVIVGAGVSRLWAVRTLARSDADVLLLDRNNYHTFQALLYQVAAAELDPGEIAQPVRSILRKHPRARFAMAEVRELNFAAQVVRTEDREIPYDFLILALGSRTNFFGVPGAATHGFPLKTLEQGVALRNHILRSVEQAANEADSQRRRQLLTFAIVGGGSTGVEFAGALAELVQGSFARDYPALDFSDLRVVLLEGRDHLLPGMPERLQAYARERLRKMGVEVHLRSLVSQVTPESVHLANGVVLPTATTVWAAGVRGHPLAEDWDLPLAADGRVLVEPTLQLPGHPNVYVAGDLAYVEQEGQPLPLLAPVAIQQGVAVAGNIGRQITGRDPLAFHYRDPGTMATIGRNAAVVRLGRRAFTGFFAWVLWLAVHLVRLIGFRNRLVVLINWAWDYFFFERAVRLILPTAAGQDT